MSKGLLARLSEGVVLGDGGYLLELEKRGYVQAGPFTPEVSLTHPEALAELHREFMRAGAEVLQALTFYASEDKLATVGLSGRVDDINRAAVAVARKVADEGDALVAGNLSLTWVYEPEDRRSHERVRGLFDRQLELHTEGGIDFVVGETFSWLGEALIATQAAKRTGLPVMTTMSFEARPFAKEGDSPAECARKLIDAGADVVGVNCLRNPEYTLPLVEEMRGAVDGYIAAQPVAYRTPPDLPDFTSTPEFPLDLDPLQMSRRVMAGYAVAARDMGINYIGSCCGSVASHVKAMAQALGKQTEAEREWRSAGKPMSAYEYYGHDG
ncbi:MAG: homocysteine S-methyltransferase family protein [Actinobacteria bacterium]|nr:homocysteine S-methyltransferase family protein [Actinomycetota bacterium]